MQLEKKKLKSFDLIKFGKMISTNSDVEVIIVKDEENLKIILKRI